MRTRVAELAELVESGIDQAVQALGCAVAEDLPFDELTPLLARTFTGRNRLDAAVSGVVGAIDTAAEAAKGELTMALSCATWLSHVLHVPSNAAHAQVRLARQLPSLPATAAAFSRGELSPHHASTIARAVESVARGGGDVADAERLMLQEARGRDPYDLHRWGLSLFHQLAPREMVAEEERRHRRRHVHLSERFDVQLVQDRDQREQVPSAGGGVGEDPGHQRPPVNGWSSSIRASSVWRRLRLRSWRSSFQVSTSVTAISCASLRARSAPWSPA